MKKFYLANGKEVKLGDTLSRTTKGKHPLFGKYCSVEQFTLSKEIVPKLLKAGVISVTSPNMITPPEHPENDPNTLYYYVKKIADRREWDLKRTINFLKDVNSLQPMAVFSILLREIATELDKKYKDHIKDSPEIYAVSSTDGRITKANKAHIKNYRNFAAFRTIDDARFACKVLKDILKRMFNARD